jgi:2-dehydro-3-deoxy-D-arabinonate dehydratase
MQIVQFAVPERGRRLGIIEGDGVIDITAPGLPDPLSLVQRACQAGAALGEVAAEALEASAGERLALVELDRPPALEVPHLLAPIDPPEVWGAGITYQRTATRYDERATETIYTRVYDADRPELFFKATAARCVGPNAPIAMRADSAQTATEPEMAVLLGPTGEVLALLCCNDVTARDIEYENPLYLPQAKIYAGSCAIGPYLTTPDEVPGPHELEITCTIERGGERWQGSTHTGRMKRTVQELASWLTRHNPIPAGTVLTTGTGIVPPEEWCLQEGDSVTIEIEGVGRLSNPVRKLPG